MNWTGRNFFLSTLTIPILMAFFDRADISRTFYRIFDPWERIINSKCFENIFSRILFF